MIAKQLQNISTPYFDSLFDDFCIWQHADGTKPIISEGYALDDATRGLILCLTLKKLDKARILFDYILKSKKGKVYFGLATNKRKFIGAPASEDAVGQVLWSFGYSISQGYREKEARESLETIIPDVLGMESLRGSIYALLGAIYVDEVLAGILVEKLKKRFEKLNDNWFWPETVITYGNGIVPYAFLRYAMIFNDKKVEKLGRKILKFLEYCCTNNRIRGPIGNDGWFAKGDLAPATYKQQPIDSAYMVWAWLSAYQLSNKATDLKNAEAWMQWFDGKNITGRQMYEEKTLKAFNGIDMVGHNESDQFGVNYHSGAETNICFLLSRWMIETKRTV